MASISLGTLLDDILHAIAQILKTEDVLALLLTSRYLNEVLTPALYATVTPSNLASARACTRTLSTPGNHMLFNRDLAALVRSFFLDISTNGEVSFRNPTEHNQCVTELQHQLKEAISRMMGLRRVRLRAFRQLTPSLCVSLFRAAASTLVSLELELELPFHWADGSQEQALRDFRPVCPHLSEVKLDLRCPTSESFYLFLAGLLSSHVSKLRSLSIRTGSSIAVSSVIGGVSVWPHLNTLEVDVATIARGWLPGTPEVRSLTVYGDNYDLVGPIPSGDLDDPAYAWALTAMRNSERVPSTAFPVLEELSCAHGSVPAFLPSNANVPRPIRKVELDHAYVISDGNLVWLRLPQWPVLHKALSCLPSSGAPVRELALLIGDPDPRRFAMEAAPYLGTLEDLLLALDEEPANITILDFGEILFASLPRLQTFHISDGFDKLHNGHLRSSFADRYSEQLWWPRRWEAHAPRLHTVAFTNRFA